MGVGVAATFQSVERCGPDLLEVVEAEAELPGKQLSRNVEADFEASACGDFKSTIKSVTLNRKSYKKAEKRCKKCPLCKEFHAYRKVTKKGELMWPSQRLDSCPTYGKMSQVEQNYTITRLNICQKCLSWNHDTVNCDVVIGNKNIKKNSKKILASKGGSVS